MKWGLRHETRGSQCVLRCEGAGGGVGTPCHGISALGFYSPGAGGRDEVSGSQAMGFELESYERDRTRPSRRTLARFHALPAGLLGPRPRWVSINEVSRERHLPEPFLLLLQTPPSPPCVSGLQVPPYVCARAPAWGGGCHRPPPGGCVSMWRSRRWELGFLWSVLSALGLSRGSWS